MATYQKNEDITFVNPYTFVPLSEDDPKRIDAEAYYSENKEALQSGYLQCHIEVKTPLAIPDVEDIEYSEPTKKDDEKNDPDDKHPSYRFFKLNGKPVIPGSSIRGAIRSVYETMTDSCMCTSNIETGFSQRIDPSDCYKPALLVRNDSGNWELYDAKKYSVRFDPTNKHLEETSFSRVVDKNEAQINGCRYGDRVTFRHKIIETGRTRKLTVETFTKNTQGYYGNEDRSHLFIGESFPGKKKEYVFFVDKWKNAIAVDQKEIDAAFAGLKETIDIYRDDAINKNYDGTTHLGYPGFERACENGIVPLWYKESDGHLYFSMAAIGRKWFLKAYNELLGTHKPCTDRKSVCPACLLFGMIGDNNDGHQSLGSRTRISDAHFNGADENQYLDEKITLKELASPKPSYLAFYSKQGKSYDNDAGGIRGRKYYWHNPDAENNKTIYQTKETTKRNATVDLIKPGAKFDFKIYFDQITQEQLNELMAVVTLGKGTEYCHKIGHGKPLGLGSVKITISQVVKRTYQDGAYQWDVQNDPEIKADLSEELQNVLSFTDDFDGGTPISYPWVKISDKCTRELGIKELKENVLGAHQWFNEFKKEKNAQGQHRFLPEILTTDAASGEKYFPKQKLPIYELIDFKPEDIK